MHGVNYMNAIILAAGKSSRMYKSGSSLPKGLLSVLGLPNIERTIFMLHMIDVYDIIIAVPFNSIQFDYLAEKYSCTIIHIPLENKNTLSTMNYLIEYIGDSFIVESDVVCCKNIFRIFEHSTYYVMKYDHPECDEWNVITDSDNNILNFEIGTHLTPAIFGISFWIQKDCYLLKEYLKAQLLNGYAEESNFFWDDNILELLGKICLKTYEIASNSACEMNTVSEYQYAIKLCHKMIYSTKEFFDKSYIREKSNNFQICNSQDKEANIYWLEKLFAHYNEKLDLEKPDLYNYWFSFEETVFIVHNVNNQEVAFFSFIIEEEFILLRRLFIDASYRAMGLGKKIISYMQLYALSCNKDLRVNVYDKTAAGFYIYLGAEKIFSTYHWKISKKCEGDTNEQ